MPMKYPLKKLYHGACYYPELWDDDVIKEDIRLMKETGINLVRIGEFWWSTIEPNPGEYRLGYITDLLDLFNENDIDVVMCTPTPTPPIWVTDGHPERLHVDASGQVMIHGSRQHICTNNREFRDLSYQIIDKIAEVVGNHPAVVLWQLDNEFKAHVSECFCECCKEQWHHWLEVEYGTIQNLNQTWRAQIWSEDYRRFDQVPTPSLNTPFLHHASLTTMYGTFHRRKIAEFATEQAEMIRKHSAVPITTNAGMGFAINNEWLFENLDMVGFDTYASTQHYHAFTINCDLWRGIKKTEPFWLLETSTSHGGAIDRQPVPHPNGYLVSEAVSNFALGGASFTYWLWRQQAVGCEIIHSAVLSAWGKPSVGYANVLAVEKARKEIESFMLSTKLNEAELAFTYSDVARLFMNTEPHKSRPNKYRTITTDLYKSILKTGIPRDLIPENMSFDGYKMLMTPFLMHVSADYLARAKQFVRAGGIWIVGPMTGGRTAVHTVTTDTALGSDLEEFAGVEALYTYPIEGTGTTGMAFGVEAPLSRWSTVFELKGAKAIGVTQGGITPEMPFITEHAVGKGKVIMVGSLPIEATGEQLWEALIEHYAIEAGIELKFKPTAGTLAIPRYDEEHQYLVLVNMDGKGGSIHLPQPTVDILAGKALDAGKIEIKPFAYRIIQLKNRRNRE